MLPKRRRLTSQEVQEVLAGGRSKRGTALSLKTLENKGQFACAVVVSKKLAKTAVVRNRLRRQVYSALRKAALPQSGHAILFVLSIPPKDASAVFTLEIQKLLHV